MPSATMLLRTLNGFLAAVVKAAFTGFPASCCFCRKALNVAEWRDAFRAAR